MYCYLFPKIVFHALEADVVQIAVNFDHIVLYDLYVADIAIFFRFFLYLLHKLLTFFVTLMCFGKSVDYRLGLALDVFASYPLADQASINFHLLVFCFGRDEEVVDETFLVDYEEVQGLHGWVFTYWRLAGRWIWRKL